MNFYEADFKLNIVKEYLEGTLGGRALANKYGTFIQCLGLQLDTFLPIIWKRRSQKPTFPQKYTSEFKRDVLHFIETTGASFGEAARKFKLPTGSMISRWQRSSLSSKEQVCQFEKDGLKEK
ncbi:hypothetical protein GQR36_13735 [Enterococcus termitis]